MGKRAWSSISVQYVKRAPITAERKTKAIGYAGTAEWWNTSVPVAGDSLGVAI